MSMFTTPSSHTRPARVRGGKTSYYQKLAIVEWLEVPSNFNLIVGKASVRIYKYMYVSHIMHLFICIGTLKGVIAGSKLTKTSAYQDLADFVSSRMQYSMGMENCSE